MHLSVARLCLDCHEIHDQDRCPVCTSEAFGFMTRWIDVEAPSRPDAPQPKPPASPRLESYRRILNGPKPPSTAARWLRNGGVLVVAGYLARWGWQIANQHTRGAQKQAPKEEPGESG